MTHVRYAARSLAELRNREVEATSNEIWSTVLVATYRTVPEVVAAVLPPPLQPTEDPLVRVTIATVDLGRGYPIFGAGTFAVHARHDDVTGDYALVMPMTTEQAVIGGRETFGEPKKIAAISLDRSEDSVVGSFARMGTTFLELAGTVIEEVEPAAQRTRTSFYLKFLPSPTGKGFDGAPLLVHVKRKERTRRQWRLDGEVILRESRFDPVADLPVREIVEIELAERSSFQTGEVVAELPADWIEPFAHQRYDDMSPAGDKS